MNPIAIEADAIRARHENLLNRARNIMFEDLHASVTQILSGKEQSVRAFSVKLYDRCRSVVIQDGLTSDEELVSEYASGDGT